jgi:hypothetical protein
MFNIRRDRNVGALATVGREREGEGEKNLVMVRT